MKLVINNKEYAVCDNCGTFKSSERCYNCRPLQSGDLDVCDQLRQYYGVVPKPTKDKLIKHHLLEYYFTQNQLVKMGLYYNVPDWQLLETTYDKHWTRIGKYKLHEHQLSDSWEQYKSLTEPQLRELINNIPKEVIETFKN